MPWSTPIPSDDVVAIHTALVPTANGDGEIILIGGDNHDHAAANAHQFDHAQRFNCRFPNQALTYVHAPAFDLFCCGHAFLADGRLLVAGGTGEFPLEAGPIHSPLGHFAGHRHCSLYNPPTGAFVPASDMGPQAGRSVGGGRWYPTLCTLATGEVLAIQGHPSEDDTRHGNNTPERYQSLADRWVMLPAIGDEGGVYPRLHVLRDSSVFVSSQIPGFAQNIALDPWSGTVRQICNLPDGAYRGMNCPSVLLPLVPADNYQPRILLCGGGTSQMIDLGQSSPSWTTVPRNGSTMSLARSHGGATLLPTLDVLLTGGASEGDDQAGVFEPEIYTTPINHSNNTYTGGLGRWDTINQPATVLRNYHSSALLMPDGRVWTAGGNSATQPDTPPSATQKQIEIFDPPYPAGTRPTITSGPSVLAYGDVFPVTFSSAAPIATAVLMRCGSSTHAYNPDQRAVVLSFNSTGANTLSATAPPNGAVAPPGNYMLFIVDNQGRPCSYASFVRVGGELSMFTNRSHFSIHEVQALLTGGTARFVPNAFYVVLDGFAAADLAGPPDRPFPPAPPQFTFTGGGAVPDLSAELVDVLQENPSAPPNVTQRITLAYRLRFTSTNAFNGIAAGDEREIRIDVAWGPSHASGHMFVFLHEHVYALDGSTPWLSIDVRVGKVARGAALAGLVDNDPITYVQAQINRFRSLDNDEFHPFINQLSTDQNVSVLELLPSVGGATIDNFAFAKVRFRAPSGIDATPVKVFFRLFTTAVTNLDYDDSTIYQRSTDGANALAQQGTVGGAVASIPFFATARANLGTNPDTANVDTLHGGDATEVVSYFGCWLDFNHDTTIQNQIRGRHQCLVAEIHYPPSPIRPHASPANNDQLSQRNLAILHSDNPGWPAAHTVSHTFELKPSEVNIIRAQVPVSDNLPSTLAVAKADYGPDELFIRWNDLPRDSVATLYIPGTDVNELLNYAAMRPGMDSLAAIDNSTIRCRVGDATYLPLPGGRATNLPGLLTIQLPPTVRAGTVYTVSVHQISGRRRNIIGSFEVTIPVSHSALLVADAERDLAALRGIGATIPTTDRWYPVFQQYLKQLGDQVRGFGGNPDFLPPSRTRKFCCYLAWLAALALALFVITFGFAGTAAGLLGIVLGLVFLFTILLWQYRCGPGFCLSLSPFLLGLGAGAGILGLLTLGGVTTTTSITIVFSVFAIVMALLALLGLARRCLPLCEKDE